MENNKRFLLPAFIAVLLHGLLISLNLPAHQPLSRSRQAQSISIEINSVSPRVAAPAKKIDSDQKATTAEAPSETIEPQKNTRDSVSIIAPKKRKKVISEIVRVKQKTTLRKADTTAGRHESQVKSQSRDNTEVSAAAKNAPSDTDTTKNRRPEEKVTSATKETEAQPIYLRNKQPSYPEIARRRGYTGEVLLSVLVDAGGAVTDIKIHHSSGHSILDKAALQAVRNWLFLPATRNGRPVAMRVDVPVRFQLTKY